MVGSVQLGIVHPSKTPIEQAHQNDNAHPHAESAHAAEHRKLLALAAVGRFVRLTGLGDLHTIGIRRSRLEFFDLASFLRKLIAVQLKLVINAADIDLRLSKRLNLGLKAIVLFVQIIQASLQFLGGTQQGQGRHTGATVGRGEGTGRIFAILTRILFNAAIDRIQRSTGVFHLAMVTAQAHLSATLEAALNLRTLIQEALHVGILLRDLLNALIGKARAFAIAAVGKIKLLLGLLNQVFDAPTTAPGNSDAVP